MSLQPGSSIGAYEIVRLIGAGGMGEVYRARDLTLNREVALKVLPTQFTSDTERVARFRREAQVLAALNHPNIAQVHGFEESGGVPALVMELVEGRTLAELIAQGPLPISTALPIARQIAEALEAAHERSIVHRDLKPANVKVRDDGTVKVLDFGLAKAFETEASADARLTQSPTLTLAATQPGIVLGTAAYMSPEQARGKVVDKRSDIWSFGCVLYEMLTGQRPFGPSSDRGDEVSDILARILEREPDWSLLPPALPSPIRRLLQRSLQKDRRRRLPDMADARLEIDEALAPQPEATATAAPLQSRGTKTWAVAATVFVVTAAVFAGAAALYVRRPAPPPDLARLTVALPENTRLQVSGGALGAAPGGNSGSISPDGRKLLLTLTDATGRWQLWIRAIDSLTAQPLPDTENANSPFWSPDSRYVGFFAGGKLKKIDVAGGPPTTICDAQGGRGGAWSDDDVIVFAPSNTQPLYRVSAAGGEPTQATRLQAGETWHRSPSFLPDGRHFLYRAMGSAPGIFVGELDSTSVTRLRDADTNAVYAPPGYLLFVRQSTLVAQPFDAGTLQLSGEPLPIAEGVATDLANGLSAFAVSDTGVLTYRTGGVRAVNFQLAWRDRTGREVEPVGSAAPYRGVDVSPDGEHIAVHRHDGQGGDIWLFERARGAMSRFTFDTSQDNAGPVWSPDGQSLAYASIRDRKWGVYRKSLRSADKEDQLLEADTPLAPTSWSPDGRSIVYEVASATSRSDLWLLAVSGDTPARPLARTLFNEANGRISPDGKWLAYSSNESGRAQVYLESFPQGGNKMQVSVDGGDAPRWRKDGAELYYVMSNPAGLTMTAVGLKPDGATLHAGRPQKLFDFDFSSVTHISPYEPYDVSDGGQRFLVPSLTDEQLASSVTVVLNWWSALRK